MMTCAECGYNLHGLPPESACPECGRPIADSVAAAPVVAWRPHFRLGVLLLGLGLAALPFAGDAATRNSWRFRGALVNRDGLLYLTQALLLLPAAWWMTTPAPFLRRDPRRLRPWLLALTAAQVAAAALVIGVFYCRAYACQVALLSTYALAPFPYVVELWLLLVLLARPLDLVPDALPRWAARVVRWLAIYFVLAPAVVFAVINFARVYQIDHPIPYGANYLPEPWHSWLAVLVRPAWRAQGAVWLATLLVVGYCLFRLRRGIGLPQRNFAGA